MGLVQLRAKRLLPVGKRISKLMHLCTKSVYKKYVRKPQTFHSACASARAFARRSVSATAKVCGWHGEVRRTLVWFG